MLKAVDTYYTFFSCTQVYLLFACCTVSFSFLCMHDLLKGTKANGDKAEKGLSIQALGPLWNNFLIAFLSRNISSTTHSPVFLGDELSARVKEVQLKNKDNQLFMISFVKLET